MACRSDEEIANNLPEPSLIFDQIIHHTVDPAKFSEGKPGSLCLEFDIWLGGEAKSATFHEQYSVYTSEDGKRFVERIIDRWVNISEPDDILEAFMLPYIAMENAAIEKLLQG